MAEFILSALYLFDRDNSKCLSLFTDTDRDFDPSAELLANDYDDERTMEEEENLSENSCSSELDELAKVK